MVQINRSNIPRRVRGPAGRSGALSLGSHLRNLAASVPQIANLSPADRALVLTGAALCGVVSLAFAFLLAGAFVGSSEGADPRLSSDLRKTGLSDEALLRRGGGRRIHVGPRPLDASENAAALDIIKALECDELQEEVEREWQTVLDKKKFEKEGVARWDEGDKDWDKDWDKEFENDFGDGGNGNGYRGGVTDDFAGELAGEMGAVEEPFGRGNDKAAADFNPDEGKEDLFNPPPLMDDDIDGIANHRRNLGRRLLLADDIGDLGGFSGDGAGWDNNYDGNAEPANRGLRLTARHLFCLAAEGITLPRSASDPPGPKTHCDVDSMEVRDELLYLWSSARAQMPEDVLARTLRATTEHKETLRGHEVHLWYPRDDRGATGMLDVLNSGYEGRAKHNFDGEPAEYGQDDLYRFHDIPSKFLGPNKLFVDVGSALGLTSMLISYLYPGTTIVSIEPASPSWLIQNINFRCNLSRDQLQYVHPILAGVGTRHHDDNDSMMKMVWRPSRTTATRNWDPEATFDYANDIEMVVRLRTLRAILAEATPEDLPLGTPISVLNLDCEGCEYNLIPSMAESSFKSVGLVLGRTNWGYIPTIKKPSSDRARTTHERLCGHYNFAKRCKECCDFPSLAVRPRIQESETGLTEENTVAEVAGDMCNGFEEWAKDQKLHDIPDDYGWDEVSAFAAT